MLAVGIIIISCQKEEMGEDKTAELEVLYEEYFRAEVDGVVHEIEDSSGIGGTIYPSFNSGVINFDFWGEIYDETKEEDYYTGFTFKVCFYDGPGTYYTGTDKTVSWADYWEDFEIWENNYAYGLEPGEVFITKHEDDFVEGTFKYWAYNEYLDSTVYVQGEFGLLLEPFTDF